MYIALDSNFNRVHIDDTLSKNEYFCPYCKTQLEVRKGTIRRHHFAHAKNAVRDNCDSWLQERNTNLSTWHDDWQSKFPKDNQEIPLQLGEIRHRADVMIGRTVMEFQHSPLSSEKFENRNKFYAGLGHKVIWMFDFIAEYSKEEFKQINNTFYWNRAKKTFRNFSSIEKSLQIELYFQISDISIIRVTSVSPKGFEQFMGEIIGTDDFIKNLQLQDGTYPLPEPEDLIQNPEYLAFKEKYNVSLNHQQERAVQTITGANLLLAVPGSGKTTVLVNRIGYMIHKKHINPYNILAMTYTTKAAKEMNERYKAKFGNDGVKFKTINAVAEEIIRYYCEIKNKYNDRPELLDNNYSYLRKAYRAVTEEYPSEAEVKQLGMEITRVKNNSELQDFQSFTNHFEEIKKKYDDLLKQDKKMDFDDQIIFAIQLMKSIPEISEHFKNQYRYLCVDEAQDTSYEQHKLIKMLAGDNIFMVGDEDQSIYGFRGAYPHALTNFKSTYPNPYILRMETNYRSYKEITDIANIFIERNYNRHPKSMLASRDKGGTVTQLRYRSRYEEVDKIFELCRKIQEETAILYRDSDCAICLIAKMLKYNIDFNLLQNSTTFFTNRVVLDIIACIRLVINPNDVEAFKQIYYKTGTKLKKQEMENVIKVARGKRLNIVDTLKIFNVGNNPKGKNFINPILQLSKLSPSQAVRSAFNMLTDPKTSRFADELEMLANNTSTLSEFLDYIENLKGCVEQYEGDRKSLLTLSTIHSAKGMEFKNVIILDVNDGFIPKNPEYIQSTNENKKDEYQEERRLFYVAMTRAKDNLSIVRVDDTPSSFFDEVFGKPYSKFCSERKKSSTHSTEKIYNNAPSLNIDINHDDSVDVGNKRFYVGTRIRHIVFGCGTIEKIECIGESKAIIVHISFDNGKKDKFPLVGNCITKI